MSPYGLMIGEQPCTPSALQLFARCDTSACAHLVGPSPALTQLRPALSPSPCLQSAASPMLCKTVLSLLHCSTHLVNCIAALLAELCLVAAGFMVFAMFIMPKLKVDPEEMKEMLGQKETAPEKEKVPTIKGRQHR